MDKTDKFCLDNWLEGAKDVTLLGDGKSFSSKEVNEWNAYIAAVPEGTEKEKRKAMFNWMGGQLFGQPVEEPVEQ